MTAVTLAPMPTIVPMGRRRRGRPPTITRALIAQAVLDVGFDQLTYAAVGTNLRVSLATLFRHVRGRDELSRLGLDLAVRQHEWPRVDGPWRAMLERTALAMWDLWERHPGAAVEVSRGVVPVAATELVDQVGAALLQAGFTPENAARAVDLVFDLVVDSRRGADVVDVVSSVLGGVRDDLIRRDPHAWFVRTLDVVLAGIDAELSPGLRPEVGPA